jgi:tritrans,polycis-undecaprenyl-diphosphate synthase [geranylgeranyl-diphosphate specific]
MVDIPKSIMNSIPSIPSIISPLKSKKVPMHIAVSTGPVKSWAVENKKEMAEAVKKHIENLDSLLDMQLKSQSRVLTIHVRDYDPEIIPALKQFFSGLIEDERIHKNQVRIFVIGQWYELDTEMVDTFKELMERTKQYDNLFLNFCVRYDGQEEVLGAIRLMARKISSGKLKEEDLTLQSVKENLYSSYFPPPELVIEPGCSYSGLLLWDAKGATIYYTNKHWMLFDKKEFDDAISFYSKTRCAEE